jgi:ketosteroid isomerase-like protein
MSTLPTPPVLTRAIGVAIGVAIAASVSCSATAIGPEHGDAADRAQILRLYEATRQAHLNRDPNGFVAADADTVVNISDGAVHVVPRDSAAAHVRQYVADRTFAEVRDLDPPRIEVSPDGNLAWVVGHVMVRGTYRHADSVAPFAFSAAWVDLWRKSRGQWRIVVHANTQRDSAVAR